MASTTRVVVIGAGPAGVRLARRLGELGTPVTLIGDEGHPPYNRVLLAEVLAGRLAPEVIALPAPARLVRARVTGIDRERRVVRCADGTRIGYGRLVLATGSNPVLPPLRGLFPRRDPESGPADRELPRGVHAFRTMDDCLALSRAVRPGLPAVVIGGGLLGVSAARALAARGARVTLVQQSERLMERHLDAPAARLVRHHLEALGVEVHTGLRVRDVRCVGGAVRSVEMADGYVLDADLVVLACGVRPRTGLAAGAGLEVRTGIVVDDRLRTADPCVHAVGDCAEHDGTVYGLAAPALEQADTLAEILSGSAAARYTGTRSLTRLTLDSPAPYGDAASRDGAGPLDLAAFGEPRPRPGDDVVRLADATRGTYRAVVVRGDRLVGGVLVGELGAVGTLARAWEGAEPLPSEGPLLHLLTPDGGL